MPEEDNPEEEPDEEKEKESEEDDDDDKSSRDDSKKEKIHMMSMDDGYDDMADDNNFNLNMDTIPGAPFLDEDMVEAMEDQDEQIEKMAESYARRTTERTGRKTYENAPVQRFNVRPRDSNGDEEMMNENEDDGVNPRRRGRPQGMGKKQVDFEEALNLQRLRKQEQISSLAARAIKTKGKKKQQK